MGDDVEALGWLLTNALFSRLPWFTHLEQAYKSWPVLAVRCAAVRHAQLGKRQLLERGWHSLGEGWEQFANMPSELHKFLHMCRQEVRPEQPLDYGAFATL